VITFTGTPGDDRIYLTDRLMLTGRVTRESDAVSGALVTLSATSGELRASTHTNADGRYRLRLPPPGHHVLTVVDPGDAVARSIKIFTTIQSAVADVDLSVHRATTSSVPPHSEVG
jgi:hypothetical protein